MVHREFDIAIIGLGPAGATLARLLDERYRIIAIDRKSLGESDAVDGAFQKPCGGLLSPDAQKALARFSLALPKSVLVDPQIFAVRTVDLGANLTRYYQRFYLNMNRHLFDRWLVSLLPSRVQIVDRARCTSVREVQGGYEVAYEKEGEERTVFTRFLVGADGAQSLVREAFFPKARMKRYLAVQEWHAGQGARPHYCCFFDKAITDSYAWSLSKDDFLLIGGAFPMKSAKEGMDALKQKLARRGYALGQPKKTEACVVLQPKAFRHTLGRDGVFLLGEAAGLISASSLEGISYAMGSARALAQALNLGGGSIEWAYRKRLFPLRCKLALKNTKAFFLFTPLLRGLIMRSGIQSIGVKE